MRAPRPLQLAGLAALAGLGLVTCAREPAPPPPGAGDGAPRLLEHLGGRSYPITTTSDEAQHYFDQGLALAYAFNHDAAIRSFQAAEQLDPGCAMCAWGVGLAYGPNINAPMGPEAGRAAWAATQRARARAAGATEVERDLIEALAKRYEAEPQADRAALDLAYANAMREVHREHPEDLEVATLFAESLMDLHPWDYWLDGAVPRDTTPELLGTLEFVLERDPNHIGANHYYIHAVEEFHPERGEPSADRLTALGLASGHLVHMPSHIYWRVGRYDDATAVNQTAAAADEAFFAWCRGGAFYSAAYYGHNLHFLWAAASTEGRSELAESTARKLEASTRDRLDEFPFLEEFVAIPMLTAARFGHWDSLLGTPKPDPKRPYLTGVWHYTRGLALLRTGQPEAASAELASLAAVAKSPEAAALGLAGGTASAAALLGIGAAHLEGEIAAARGDHDAAVAALERAVAQQDALLYMEPPPFYFPTRQALGAVLLDAGRAADAAAVYRRDLEQYPRNGWSLYGLWQSLAAQNQAPGAALAETGYRNAFAQADVTLEASRF
jgi:tetratricopeptide (TPR) repeat protein